MLKRRKQQLLMIVALVVGIASLSIGFAAFSATLNISSSAKVTPDSSSFSVVFSGSESDPNVVNIYPDDANMGTVAKASGTTISDMNIVFNGSGYQVVEYSFYVHNTGAFPAYLKSIDFGEGKVCRATGDANDALVQAACDDIVIGIYSDVIEIYQQGGGVYEYGGYKLDAGDYEKIVIYFLYNGEALADGEFSVEFDDINFNYSSADNDEITFTLLGNTYTAIENMTWSTWVDSKYNTADFSLNAHYEVFSPTYGCINKTGYETIEKNGVYNQGNNCYNV